MSVPRCASVAFMLALALPLSAVAVESLDDLARRAGVEKMHRGISAGDNTVFSNLPAKGYPKGLSSILVKYHVVANPKYSFVDCDKDKKLKSGSTATYGKQPALEPGCVVSLKLARRLPDQSYQDLGIKIEYAIGLGDRRFEPNNSQYAQHAVAGDGWLEAQLDH